MNDSLTLHDRVRGIWAELLHKDPAQIPDDRSFLRLGGDSVMAVRLSALIRQRLEVKLALSDVRVDTTLNDLTAVVERRAVDGGAAAEAIPSVVGRRVDPGETFPLLPLQQGYFVGQQDGWELSYESAHYYFDYGLVGVDDGDEAAEALVDAIERLVMHQPTLRARITADGSQRVLDAADPKAIPPVQVHDLREGRRRRGQTGRPAPRAQYPRSEPTARARSGPAPDPAAGGQGPDPHGLEFADLRRLVLDPAQPGTAHLCGRLERGGSTAGGRFRRIRHDAGRLADHAGLHPRSRLVV